jgi:hypothetical protein
MGAYDQAIASIGGRWRIHAQAPPRAAPLRPTPAPQTPTTPRSQPPRILAFPGAGEASGVSATRCVWRAEILYLSERRRIALTLHEVREHFQQFSHFRTALTTG